MALLTARRFSSDVDIKISKTSPPIFLSKLVLSWCTDLDRLRRQAMAERWTEADYRSFTMRSMGKKVRTDSASSLVMAQPVDF